MKKILASVLVLVCILCTFCGCTEKSAGYTLVEKPKELTIDAAVLSEDLEGNILNIDEDIQLLCGDAEEGVYIYAIHPAVYTGVLVKYDGVIQYFPWSFTAQLAQPDLYVTDYNGDGKKDIAFTYLESVGMDNYNETLHILYRTKDGFEDKIYSSEKAASDVSRHLLVRQIGKNGFSVSVDGKEQKFSLSGYGNFVDLYTGDVQDFTLGEQITVSVNPGLVFDDTPLPVYSAFKYHADVRLVDGSLTQVSPEITF